MSPTARAEICIPNVAHHSVIMRLLRGDWTYEDNGLLDRTHMRFFTRDTTKKMFEDSGWFVRALKPRIFGREKGMKHARAFATLGEALGFDPRNAAENMLPLQWVFSLSPQKPKPPRRIAAIGIGTKVDALSKIRLRQPLAALANAGKAQTAIKIGSYDAVPDGEPGVFLTYRLHPENIERREHIDQKCKDGWLFVHDVDDHPEYLSGQKKNNFWSIKAAHAVTVTTPALADVCRKWNPNVFVMENQIFETSDPLTIAHQNNEKPRLFFGALNREEEWKTQCGEVVDYLVKSRGRLACDVVHEPSLFEALNGKADATFHPTQTYENFIELLSKADFALLPLFETEFNACKSDLKIIECLAHGVVPICSPYAAEQTTVPNEFLKIAETPSDWTEILDELLIYPKKVAAQKLSGLQYVQENRMWAGNAKRLDKLFDTLLADHKNLEQQRQKRLAG